MRLDCPNCTAGYDVPDGMIPPGGRHVQCTECHTRWFVRGQARPMLSEEQIITRLEARARPRPVPVPDPVPDPIPDPAPHRVPDPAPAIRAATAAATAEESFVWEDAEELPLDAPPAETPAPPPRPTAAPTPGPKPRLAAVNPEPPAAKPASHAAAPEPLPPQPGAAPLQRPAARLDLTGTGESKPAASPVRSRFVRGLLLAVAVFALALVAYRGHTPIAAGVPAAAPALDAYVGAIDALRREVATRLGGEGDG